LEAEGVPVTGRGPGAAGAPPVAGLLGIIGGLGTADATGAIGFPTDDGAGVPNRDMNCPQKF
jgi:hypothetical protein